MEQRCNGCMKIKRQSPRCEHCGYDERSNNELHQLPVGTVLQNHYVVGRVLGQGGFGITYLGWDRNLEEPIAIKEYFPSGQVSRSAGMSRMVNCTSGAMQFQEGRERFLREARTLAKLRKLPNIVQVMSFFAENNTAYIIMEYVEGITLLEYIRRRGGRLSPAETFSIIRPVMQALSQVHQAGMIHRDISPDNIMLQQNGTVKLLDFGTARDVDVSAGGQLTHSTQAVLKYGFAPAEQYTTGRAIDLRADEYALCSTIWYCLTGKLPPDAFQRLMDGLPMEWRQIPGLTPNQIWALEKGSAVRAEDRFGSLEELEQALFGAGAGFPGTAPVGYTGNGPVYTGNGPAYTGNGPVYTGNGSAYNGGSAGHTSAGDKVAGVVDKTVAFFKNTINTFSAKLDAMPANRRWLVPGIAGAVAVICLITSITILAGRGKNGAVSAASPELGVVTETTAAKELWRENVMMSDKVGYSSDDNYPVFGSQYRRSEIFSITFVDTLANANSGAWDISAAGNGSVKAWVESVGGGYDLFIGGEGGVRAPNDCEKLFYKYENAVRIDLGAFHVTSDVTNAHYMFYYCKSVVELDVSGFDTSNIKDMSDMFCGCSVLTELDVSGFNTAKVTNMSGMFSDCKAITKLDVSGFNTANVTDMSDMFDSCNSVTVLDVSGFNTAKVTNMYGMFFQNFAVTKLDLSGFDTSRVEDMSWMLRGCRSASIDLGNWEVNSLPDEDAYDKFMDEGATYNGKPWKNLFSSVG